MELLAEDANYSSFLSYLQETGIDSILQASQAFTVWAPDNDAFATLSEDVLNDDTLLKSLIQNHISNNSYTTTSFDERILVKMFNGKYVIFDKSNSDIEFGGITTTEENIVASNGVIHKIDNILPVRDNIWSFLNDNLDKYPYQMSYIKQYDTIAFDEVNSVVIGSNSLGQNVYDSVFKSSNKFFDVIGDLDREENRFSFIGLSDNVYTELYNNLESFYDHPEQDSITAAVDRLIFNNINYYLIDPDMLNGIDPSYTTTGNASILNSSNIESVEELSNGNVISVSTYDMDPNLYYKTIIHEVENSENLEIASTSDMSIQSIFDENASGGFRNAISLQSDPDGSNNYFEISYTNVLAAKYDLYVKFNSIPNDVQDTKLRFETRYQINKQYPVIFPRAVPEVRVAPDGGVRISGVEVTPNEDGLIKIGGPYENPFYVNENADNGYIFTVRVLVDVSNVELAIFDRRVGIDYIALIPVKEEDTASQVNAD